MPRVTRAAKRNNIYADVQEAASIPLPSTPQRSERAPLGEIKINEQQEAVSTPPRMELEVNLTKPKNNKPGRKKKAGINKENARPCSQSEVIEDDCESSASSAAEEACRELRHGTVDENFRAPYLDRRPQTPPSRAVRAARRKLSPSSKPQTPRFDPEIHKAPPASTTKKDSVAEDSFVAIIQSRTPAKIMNSEPIMEEVLLGGNGKEAEIVEDTLTPSDVTHVSPSRTPRIEDSVEAIDALEDAIEQAGQSLTRVENDEAAVATMDATTAGSADARKPTTTSTAEKVTPMPKANTSRPLSNKKPSAQKPPIKKPTTIALKPATTRSTAGAASKSAPQPSVSGRTTTTTKRSSPISTSTSKPTSTVTGSTTASSSSKSKTTPSSSAAPPKSTVKPFKARPSLSTTTAPFKPVKSTKQPTTSTFTLPGEAVSARLKAQREEKRKKEEEEAQARRKFKARPVPGARVSSGATTGEGTSEKGSGSGSRNIGPRPTTASRARESIAKGELPKTRNGLRTTTGISAAAKAKAATTLKTNALAKAREKTRVSSTTAVIGGPSATSASTSSSHSTSSSTPRTTKKPATTSIAPTKRTTTTTTASSSASRPSIGTTTNTSSTSKRVSNVGPGKSKDVFKSRRDSEDAAIKAKMEAAKRARAEAAERGRVASREWAERNLQKKFAAGGAGAHGATEVGVEEVAGTKAGTGDGVESKMVGVEEAGNGEGKGKEEQGSGEEAGKDGAGDEMRC